MGEAVGTGREIMIEWLSMGKYTVYVWASVGVFVVAIAADLLSARKQHKTLIKTIKARLRRRQS